MPLAPSRVHAESPVIERRALRWLLLFWCLFILYGSFIPFHFSADPAFVASQRAHFFTPLFVDGIRQFSIPDVVSNVLLFIPFGFLWVGSEIGKRVFGRPIGATLMVGAVGFMFGLGIEFGQMFSPGRTSSILDALCNGFGAFIGGTCGYLVCRAFRGKIATTATKILREHPSLVLLVLLAIAVMADAYYPFEITLDVSTVWGDLKRVHWIPFVGGPHRFWLDVLLEKGFFYGGIAALALVNVRNGRLRIKRLLVSCFCIVFAFAVEAGKLLFVGRMPNPENFILAVFGILIGVIVVAPAAETGFVRRNSDLILLLLLLAIPVYSELSPFDWVSSRTELSNRIAKIEWLPFVDYYDADPESALFDLITKVFMVAPLGFVIASQVRRKKSLAAAAGLLSGGVLETCQIALRSRIPSVTDVLLFGIASWMGAVAYERFLRIRGSENPFATLGHEANTRAGGH